MRMKLLEELRSIIDAAEEHAAEPGTLAMVLWRLKTLYRAALVAF